MLIEKSYYHFQIKYYYYKCDFMKIENRLFTIKLKKHGKNKEKNTPH